MRYGATIDGETLELDLGRQGADIVHARIGDRRYELEAKEIQPGFYWLRLGNRSIEVVVTEEKGTYLVILDGRQVRIELSDLRTALRHRHQGHSGTAQLRAPMPGKIIHLLVEDGSQVLAGQGILVMEAMKMQNELKSPKEGIVRLHGVVAGATVNSGDLLATVE